MQKGRQWSSPKYRTRRKPAGHGRPRRGLRFASLATPGCDRRLGRTGTTLRPGDRFRRESPARGTRSRRSSLRISRASRRRDQRCLQAMGSGSIAVARPAQVGVWRARSCLRDRFLPVDNVRSDGVGPFRELELFQMFRRRMSDEAWDPQCVQWLSSWLAPGSSSTSNAIQTSISESSRCGAYRAAEPAKGEREAASSARSRQAIDQVLFNARPSSGPMSVCSGSANLGSNLPREPSGCPAGPGRNASGGVDASPEHCCTGGAWMVESERSHQIGHPFK
jgi:hypothetical protein